MNTMQDFYASLSSSDIPQDNYLKILANITKINQEKVSALMSDMGWQEWGEWEQNTATA